MGLVGSKQFPPKLMVDLCGQVSIDCYNEEVDITINAYKKIIFLSRIWQEDPATGDSVDVYVRAKDEDSEALIIIAFKGTSETEQSFYNAVAIGSALTSHASSVSDAQSMLIASNLFTLVKRVLENNPIGKEYLSIPENEVEWVFTGHSRGGLLAAYAHELHFKSRGNQNPNCTNTGYVITFGSPAVTIHSEARNCLFRFVRMTDVITWTYTNWGQLVYRSGNVIYMKNSGREFQGIASHAIEGYHADVLTSYEECMNGSFSFSFHSWYYGPEWQKNNLTTNLQGLKSNETRIENG